MFFIFHNKNTVVFGLLLILAALHQTSLSLSFEPRITNGVEVLPEEIPFIVSIRIGGIHICGGSILDEDHILTAAHCIHNKNVPDMSVLAGTIRIDTGIDPNPGIKIVAAAKHEKYEHFGGYYNDIAILKLGEKLTYSPSIQPVYLPPKDWFTAGGMALIVAGWGSEVAQGDASEVLKKTDLKAVTDYDCWQRYGNVIDEVSHQCAGNVEEHSHCSGDSGGPLFLKDFPIQVGIVSWSRKPCGKHFGIYTKVVNFLDWIEKNRKL